MRVAYVIGRFQPFHHGHKALVDTALRLADHVVIVLGDTACRPDHRDPFSVAERTEMIRACYAGYSNITFTSVEDVPYDDDAWAGQVRRRVPAAEPADITTRILVGNRKDATSYYLDLFPEWEFHAGDTDSHFGLQLSATDVRTALYARKWCEVARLVPHPVFEILSQLPAWRLDALQDECDEVQSENAMWDCPAVRAYGGPILVTVDAIVTCPGHLLTIERGGKIGAGSLALPGGFLNPHERIERAILRELDEETGLKIGSLVVPSRLRVFDAVKRSSRGRVVTNAQHFHLPHEPSHYPVQGADDARRAFWMPISEVHESKRRFFSDHWHIANAFLHFA